ncbi:TPA: hypothetical protein ACQKUM_001243 [Streptococcus pyogenes]
MKLLDFIFAKPKKQEEKRTPQGLFKDVSFDDELIPINEKYPKVLKKLNRERAYKPEKHVFNQTPKVFGVDNDISYSKITTHDVHNHIRLLVLNVFGKSQNKEVLPEEYDQAIELYNQLKEWFVSSYDKRLEGLVLEDD